MIFKVVCSTTPQKNRKNKLHPTIHCCKIFGIPKSLKISTISCCICLNVVKWPIPSPIKKNNQQRQSDYATCGEKQKKTKKPKRITQNQRDSRGSFQPPWRSTLLVPGSLWPHFSSEKHDPFQEKKLCKSLRSRWYFLPKLMVGNWKSMRMISLNKKHALPTPWCLLGKLLYFPNPECFRAFGGDSLTITTIWGEIPGGEVAIGWSFKGPAPSKGWCLNPKGLISGTPYHPFGTPWRVKACICLKMQNLCSQI